MYRAVWVKAFEAVGVSVFVKVLVQVGESVRVSDAVSV